MANNPTYHIRLNDVDDILVESLSARDNMTRKSWANGKFYELPVLNQIRKYARQGTFFDGGAGFGNSSIFFARCCQQCEGVIAVEAVSKVYNVLVKNLHANIDPEFKYAAYNWALHSVSSMLATFDPPNELDYRATRMQIKERTHDDTRPGAARHNSALTQRVDDLTGVTNVTVLKLNLKGGEAEAVAGAFETISRCRPLIVAEALTTPLYDDLCEQMKLLHYRQLYNSGKRYTYIWYPKEIPL